MCGPFKGLQGILRLLEIIFSALSFIIVLFRGRMVSPWGVWCEFVWFFCLVVIVVVTVMEALALNVLLAAFLPNWADLVCGLTTLCAAMITSATIIFAAVFVCLSCISSILCFITSLVAAVCFLVDAVMQRMKCPKGYLCGLRGSLRLSEAFLGCIVLTAATDHFVNAEWFYRPFGMICSIVVFAVCIVLTALIIVLNLLTLLKALIPCGLNLIELVVNIVAVVSYVLAIILWAVFAYRRRNYNIYTCTNCSFADVNTVVVGASVNLILYIVDLVLSIMSR